MVNMMKLMKQVAGMRQGMEKAQAEIARETVEGSSGGGAVKATVRGDLTLQALTIDPKAVDPADVPMLEDLILSAVSAAQRDARRRAEERMRELTQGMDMPGLPFG